MNANYFKSLAALVAMIGVTAAASTALAQDSTGITAVQPAQTYSPGPQLAYGVAQILQLSQAKVGDDTIIAYIKNSGNSYGLNADQIIYLRQQGLSSAVLNAMLNQPHPGVLPAAPPAAPVVTTAPPPMPATYDNSQQWQQTDQSQQSPQVVMPSTPAPSVTFVQPTPTVIYAQPAPVFVAPAFVPAVSFSFGWGGGGCYHGWYGGWHGCYGGWHGGSHGSWHH
jgi:hypothetical protein